ncbi:MAG: L,D-transpeptidase family protein [Bacteriovoracia bacterium]
MKKIFILISLCYFCCSVGTLLAKEYLPAAILKLDNRFTPYVAIVEKSTHTLHLYSNNDSIPEKIKTYKIATGKKTGNKFVQGDRKTPEGIYHFLNFIPHEKLMERYGEEGKMYGAGAFTLNYPNIIDRRLGKTGGGIWLHSTDDDSRINKGLDSKGCVVVVDKDLKDVAQYINLPHTQFVIVHDMYLLEKDSWLKKRANLENVVNNWVKAWAEENLQDYLSFYHNEDFSNPRKGNFNQFRRYKRAVFANKGKPQINISDLSVLMHEKYAVVNFAQHYESSTIPFEVGKKTLYLKKDKSYKWKIVAEYWYRLEDEQKLASNPHKTYFNKKHN